MTVSIRIRTGRPVHRAPAPPTDRHAQILRAEMERAQAADAATVTPPQIGGKP